MLATRWSALVRYGLLGNTLVATTAAADPCDDVAERSISVVVGIELSPKARVIGGLEGRQCLSSKTEGVLRLELGGGPRLLFGARARPFEDMAEDDSRENVGLEAGLVLEQHSRIGAHLALSYGPHFAYTAVQGRLPLNQTDRPSHVAWIGALSPVAFRSQAVVVEGRPIATADGVVRPAIRALPIARTAAARAVRDHYASSAQLELSSVWTFLRLAAELAAVGAPDELVLAALDAADDEVRHAELCAQAAGGLTLAALADAAAAPRFVQRSAPALATLAREAWLEGCLNEGAAAEQARLVAAETSGPIAGMLATIARDESRHAALSWAVLGWVLSIAPAIARQAIAIEPARPQGDSHDPALAALGVPTARITAAAWDHAVRAARELRAALSG